MRIIVGLWLSMGGGCPQGLKLFSGSQVAHGEAGKRGQQGGSAAGKRGKERGSVSRPEKPLAQLAPLAQHALKAGVVKQQAAEQSAAVRKRKADTAIDALVGPAGRAGELAQLLLCFGFGCCLAARLGGTQRAILLAKRIRTSGRRSCKSICCESR